MPPNILYLNSHDTGRHVQPYGHAVETPNLQRFAESGVLFRQAFSAAPTCSPSRAALLTGQAPHSAGMTGLAHRGWSLNDYDQHLVNVLKRAGYRPSYHTVQVGIQHVAKETSTVGYDEVLDVESRRAEHVAPAAAQWLASYASSGDDAPFYLEAGFFETHREFPEPTAAEDARYIQPPAPLPDTPAVRRDMAAYHAMARQLDDGIGLILHALEEAGLAENTIVLITTDHGLAFPGMKCSLTDHGIGVMLMLRGLGQNLGLEAGQVVDGMVSQIDVLPTLCELAGVARPAWAQGRSMGPLLRGEVEEINDAIFAEVTYHAAYEPKRAVRTQRWKYIRRWPNLDGSERDGPVLPNCDDSPSKQLWLDHGWRQRKPDTEQLYDLVFDPNESNNLAVDSDYAEVLADLRARLDAWMRETDDPLLAGRVPAPKGARVNDADGSSPKEPVRKAA